MLAAAVFVDLRAAAFFGAVFAGGSSWAVFALAAASSGAAALVAAFLGLAARLAGAFAAADLAGDLRAAGFLAPPVAPDSVAATLVSAAPSPDASFLAEVRETVRLGLLAVAVFADLRGVAFFAAGLGGASSCGVSTLAVASSGAGLAAAFFGFAVRLVLAEAFAVADLADDLRGVGFFTDSVTPEPAAALGGPALSSSVASFLAAVREAVLFDLLAGTVFDDLREVAFFAAVFAGASSWAAFTSAAASSGAGLAAAFLGLAVRLDLAGAFAAADLADDLRGAAFLAASVVPGSAAATLVPLSSVLLEAALAADFLVVSFFAEVFRAVEAAFLALVADLEELRFFVVASDFDLRVDCAEEPSGS